MNATSDLQVLLAVLWSAALFLFLVAALLERRVFAARRARRRERELMNRLQNLRLKVLSRKQEAELRERTLRALRREHAKN